MTHTSQDETSTARDLECVDETASGETVQRHERLALVRRLPQSNRTIRRTRRGKVGSSTDMHRVDPTRHFTDATAAKAQAEARARTRIASALGCPDLTSSIRETYQKAPEYFVLMTADCASVPAPQPEAEDAPPED